MMDRRSHECCSILTAKNDDEDRDKTKDEDDQEIMKMRRMKMWAVIQFLFLIHSQRRF